MINYRKAKKRYKPDVLGSLYVDNSKIKYDERPIIYIGGQMEHRLHVLEQTGFTADPGHNMFTGSWFYDYPVFRYNPFFVNAKNLTNNFLTALEMSGLEDADVITESFGGMIASYATVDPRIHKVYAIHPPILGTPLAQPDELEKYSYLFTQYQKFLYKLIKILVNTNYGFQQDNFNGIDIRKVDLNKLVVLGSSINIYKERNKLVLDLYDMIKKATGFDSDGIVIFDEDKLKKLGINYIKDQRQLNHFDAGKTYELEYAQKLSKKF